MQPRRFSRSDEGRNDSSEQLFPVLASETVRSSSTPSHQPPPPPAKGGDERISLFWRVFGGTILSICALVVISAYQGLSNSIHDLHADLSRANEARAELVKKDEYAVTRAKMWDRLQEIQKEVAVAATPIDPMKLRIDKLEVECRTADAERREIRDLHATVKERLSQIEQQMTQGKLTQKDVQTIQQIIQGMQDKMTFREQQLKQADDERKEQVKEIQALRERLVKVEATKGIHPAPAKTTGRPMPDEDQ